MPSQRRLLTALPMLLLVACATQEPPAPATEKPTAIYHDFQVVDHRQTVVMIPPVPEHVLALQDQRSFVVVKVVNYPRPRSTPSPVFTPAKTTGPTLSSIIGAQADEEAANRSSSANPSPFIIYFEFDRADVPAQQRQLLSSIASQASSSPGAIVEVHGYTDSQGSTDYNVNLSARRAAAVKKLLTSSGLKASQVRTFAHGENAPAQSNETEDGRAKNRRATVSVSNDKQ